MFTYKLCISASITPMMGHHRQTHTLFTFLTTPWCLSMYKRTVFLFIIGMSMPATGIMFAGLRSTQRSLGMHTGNTQRGQNSSFFLFWLASFCARSRYYFYGQHWNFYLIIVFYNWINCVSVAYPKTAWCFSFSTHSFSFYFLSP